MRPALVRALARALCRSALAYGSRRYRILVQPILRRLSQLSLALLGISLDDRAPVLPTPFDLAPKESVSLIDNNSFALGDGALVLSESRAPALGIGFGRRLGNSRDFVAAFVRQGRAGRGRRSQVQVRRDPA